MSSDYELMVTTQWSGKHAEYGFAVNGREPEALDGTLEVVDEIDGGQVSGAVDGDFDRYRVWGEIESFDLDGQAMVMVDGISMRLEDLPGIGYAGPEPPAGYTGPGSSAWGGTGDPDTRGSAPAGNDRPGPSQGDGGGSPSASLDQRIDHASGRDGPDAVTVFGPSDAREFEGMLYDLPGFMSENSRVVLTDGTYNVGVLDGTISSRGGAPLLRVVGNVEDPYSVVILGPTNIGKLLKDEHLMFEGVEFSRRTQLWGVGHTFCRNVVFSDRNGNGHSSLGGKPAGARIQHADVGHRDEPDRYASYFYGTGEVYYDAGVTMRNTHEDGYIRNNNTVTIYVDGRVEFPDEKPIVVDRSVYPSDLGPKLNKIEPVDPANVF